MKFFGSSGFFGCISVAALVMAAQVSFADAILCDVNDAMANNEIANQCNNSSSVESNVSGTKSYVSTTWGADFSFVGKYDSESTQFDTDGNDTSGLNFEIHDAESSEYGFAFDLTAPDTSYWYQKTIDLVLGVKQASGNSSSTPYVSYLFNDVKLDIDGFFNSSWIHKKGNLKDNDYSHVSVFIREMNVPVPEPGTALLLTTGIFGLVVSRRRMKRAS